MSNQLDTVFNKAIGHLLEVSEGIFGEHQRWPYFRKVILKRLNELKLEVEQSKERNGADYGTKFSQQDPSQQ